MFYFSRVYLSFWVSVCLYFDVSGCKNFLLTKVYFCHLFTHLLLSCLEWCVLVFSSAFLCAIADIVRFCSLHEISIDLQSFELVCNVCDWVWVYRKWMRVCVGYAVVVFHHLADAIAVFSVMLVSRDLFSGCFVSLMSFCLFSFALSHSITCHFLSFLRTCIFILKILFPSHACRSLYSFVSLSLCLFYFSFDRNSMVCSCLVVVCRLFYMAGYRKR